MLFCARKMFDTVDKAGDGICGLCAVTYIPPGDGTPVAGEYADSTAGEPRSEIV